MPGFAIASTPTPLGRFAVTVFLCPANVRRLGQRMVICKADGYSTSTQASKGHIPLALLAALRWAGQRDVRCVGQGRAGADSSPPSL
jgi:hypothetical protein